jgi:hypothetical protein
VWLAIWASLIGVLVCLGLIIRPVRFLAGERLDDDAVPVMDARGIGPLAADGSALAPLPGLLVALAVGVVTWLAMGPWVALAVAVVVGVALVVPRGQVLLRVVSVGSLAAAALFIVAKQARGNFVVDFDWMNKFELTHAWALLATALLALDALVEFLRRRSDP